MDHAPQRVPKRARATRGLAEETHHDAPAGAEAADTLAASPGLDSATVRLSHTVLSLGRVTVLLILFVVLAVAVVFESQSGAVHLFFTGHSTLTSPPHPSPAASQSHSGDVFILPPPSASGVSVPRLSSSPLASATPTPTPSSTLQPSPSPLATPRAWAHRVPSGPPLRLAYAGWPCTDNCDFSRADQELWFFAYLVEQALGRPVITPGSSKVPLGEQLANADIILANGFDPSGRAHLEQVLRAHRPHALLLWNIIENTQKNSGFKSYNDQVVRSVDVSFGVRADIKDGPGYHHYGGWMGWLLRHSRNCSLPAFMFPTQSPASEAAAWSARANFAAIVAHFPHPPRAEICDALAQSVGPVDGGSTYRGNKNMPGGQWASESDQKIAFLQDYRFNVCPENRDTPPHDNGYVTEKLVDALMAGSIPIYWGGHTPRVINPNRVLRYTDGHMDDLVARVRDIETNPAVRDAWFAEPLLADGAQDWLDGWCLAAQEKIAAAWSVAGLNGEGARRAAAPRARLAVGVVLPNADVAQWVNLVSALPPELRGDVDLFLSVWGDIAPSANAADLFNGTDVGRPSLLASIAYDKELTWTSARNAIARRMFQAEKTRVREYDAWAFFDADAAFINCDACIATLPPDLSGPACCTAALLRELLPAEPDAPPSHEWATLGYWTIPFDTTHVPPGAQDDFFIMFEWAGRNAAPSPDGKFTGIARDAVPVLLPWDETRDAVNWHDSQMLFWYFQALCLDGYNAAWGRSVAPLNEQHHNYNQGHAAAGAVNWMEYFETVNPGLQAALNFTADLLPYGRGPPSGPISRKVDRPVRAEKFIFTERFSTCAAARAGPFDSWVRGGKHKQTLA